MSSVRQVKMQTSRRNRECWNCNKNIIKSSKYILRQVRYDKTIISFYYHTECALALGIELTDS